MLKAEIIAIGDELLIGQVLNTNAQWLAQELNANGLAIVQMTTIPDSKEAILNVLAQGLERADFIFITGGLGPTKDDITKYTLAEFFDSKLVLNQERLEELKIYFEQRGRVFNKLNYTQAMLPDNCFIVRNEVGTASGMWFANAEGKVVVSMPGVPYEMKDMMTKVILPKIQKEYIGKPILHRTIRTFGVGESEIAQEIEKWENQLPSYFKLAYLPNVGQVRLRLSGSHMDKEYLKSEMDALIIKLYGIIGSYIYGEAEDELETVVGNLLQSKKLTFATAESCSGGFLAHKITSVSGSSSYYIGSVIAYSNQIKIGELGVAKEIIEKHGAVSQQTVEQMALGIRSKFDTDFALSTSGIAGPSGGSLEKPVGTVWIALATRDEVVSQKLILGKDRGRNIQLSAMYALNMLRLKLLKV